MSTINLNKFQFDYDLTFAMTVHSPSGQLISRFGGRNKSDANAWQSQAAIENWLRRIKTLARDNAKKFNSPVRKNGLVGDSLAKTIYDIPAFAKGLRGKKPECVHCHSVFPALRRQELADKTWTPAKKFVYPDPIQIGLRMDPILQTKLLAVIPKSPAKKAGIRPGDVLVKVEKQEIFSIADLQHALHITSETKTVLSTSWRRGSRLRVLKIKLKNDWKRCSPLDYSWRPMKWELSPAPGFGGQVLTQETKNKIGLKAHPFAMRVDYIVDWGPRKSLGSNVKKSGLRKGDIVVAVNKKTDFQDGDHFHAWIRLHCQIGQVMKIQIWRNGKIQRIELPLIKG